MTRPARIGDFHRLGQFLNQSTVQEILASRAELHNSWFIPANTIHAIRAIIPWLNADSLGKWLERYPEPSIPRKIGIVAAGNIPMACFHDFLCVLASGHFLELKLSSQDDQIIPMLFKELCAINPEWSERCIFVERISSCDAVIATGSNNTSRYFEYYFRSKPLLLRKNRTAVAVLTGSETDAELHSLANDILLHFGLGCRSVSHLVIPHDFNLDRLIGNMMHWHHLASHHKYANSLTYQRAILMVDLQPFIENGLCIFRESEEIASPVSVLHYSRYQDIKEVHEKVDAWKDRLQGVVAREGLIKNSIPFGSAQQPDISDYADGLDTMAFLSGI